MEAARGLSAEDAAHAIHSSMERASRNTVRLLLGSMTHYTPQEGEFPQAYLLRLSQSLILEFLASEFAAGTLSAIAIRPALQKFADVLVAAGGYHGPHASQHFSSLAATWASDAFREQLLERFWLELPQREKSAVMRGHGNLVRAHRRHSPDASATCRCWRGCAASRSSHDSAELCPHALSTRIPRRAASSPPGLASSLPLLESLWPNQLPEELSRGTMSALAKETLPETSALLASFLETLGRIASTRGDFAGFENILLSLERVPRDAEHEHMTALGHRLVANDRWMLLVDAALANRALDQALPRLLQRDPERLLDRLTLLLTDPRGPEMISPMARLLRAIGIPALTLLETRLFEARRQRVSAAIKLLAAADPDRLLRGLTRAMASWEWNLQDLAVSELARPANAASAQSTAFVFSAILSDAHPLVVPMMIDQIGIGQETTAVSHAHGNRRRRTRDASRSVCPHQSHRSTRPHARL